MSIKMCQEFGLATKARTVVATLAAGSSMKITRTIWNWRRTLCSGASSNVRPAAPDTGAPNGISEGGAGGLKAFTTARAMPISINTKPASAIPRPAKKPIAKIAARL